MNYSNLVIKLTRSEGRGQRFESSRDRHKLIKRNKRFLADTILDSDQANVRLVVFREFRA